MADGDRCRIAPFGDINVSVPAPVILEVAGPWTRFVHASTAPHDANRVSICQHVMKLPSRGYAFPNAAVQFREL
jgi:hypothetical protein